MLKDPHAEPAGRAEARFERALVWLRRDLRLADHAALQRAAREARQLWCVFVFDSTLLDVLPREDRRVAFIRESLVELDEALAHIRPGAGLVVRHGVAVDEVPALAQRLGVQAVYASHDDDPAALKRDATVRERLRLLGVALHTSKDHVVFERSEVLTAAGKPFTVFTPYKNAWLKHLAAGEQLALAPLEPAQLKQRLASSPSWLARGVPSLAELGFKSTNLHTLRLPTGERGAQTLLADFLDRIDRYDQVRDHPALKGPSYLSTHLRFGTVSIRQMAREAHQRMVGGSRGAEVWLGELIWRDFYHQLLHHHPHVVGRAFKPAYDAIMWARGPQAEEHFAAWCEGRTGYPLVDAAMAQINASGYMHNRLRMVVASFLTKDLGLDWRWGEAYFAQHLNDFDLAANNGGWQWAASTGCDAQPWFRIFNPVTQSERFDAQGAFIRRYLPQLARLPDALIHAPWLARPVDLAAAGVELGKHYPLPIVDHAQARLRTLERYAVVKQA